MLTFTAIAANSSGSSEIENDIAALRASSTGKRWYTDVFPTVVMGGRYGNPITPDKDLSGYQSTALA